MSVNGIPNKPLSIKCPNSPLKNNIKEDKKDEENEAENEEEVILEISQYLLLSQIYC